MANIIADIIYQSFAIPFEPPSPLVVNVEFRKQKEGPSVIIDPGAGGVGEAPPKYLKGNRVQRTFAKDCIWKTRFCEHQKHFIFTRDGTLSDFCEVPITKNVLGLPGNLIQGGPNTPDEQERVWKPGSRGF